MYILITEFNAYDGLPRISLYKIGDFDALFAASRGPSCFGLSHSRPLILNLSHFATYIVSVLSYLTMTMSFDSYLAIFDF